MYLKKVDGTTLPIFATSFSHRFRLNYKLTRTTANTYYPIDRGSSYDRYETTLMIRGERSSVYELYNAMVELRNNKQEFVIGDFQENVFSDMVDHSNEITCSVIEMGKQLHPRLHIAEFSVKLRAIKPPTVTSIAMIPPNLCAQNDWRGSVNWDYNTKTTYSGDSYSVDRESDTLIFRGKYVFTLEESIRFMQWYASVRGRVFSTTSQDWGVSEMFGDGNGDVHDACVYTVEYFVTSPTQRQLTIELRKNGLPINITPLIVEQPTDQYTQSGGSAVFTVGVSNDVTGIQWYKNNTIMDGETGETLAISNAGGSPLYDTIVECDFGDGGSDFVSSDWATILAPRPVSWGSTVVYDMSSSYTSLNMPNSPTGIETAYTAVMLDTASGGDKMLSGILHGGDGDVYVFAGNSSVEFHACGLTYSETPQGLVLQNKAKLHTQVTRVGSSLTMRVLIEVPESVGSENYVTIYDGTHTFDNVLTGSLFTPYLMGGFDWRTDIQLKYELNKNYEESTPFGTEFYCEVTDGTDTEQSNVVKLLEQVQ